MKLVILMLSFMMLLLVACDSKKDEKISKKTDIEQITERSQQRWNAVVKNDFDKVYTYATPAYRKAFNKGHFFAQYGGMINRKSAKPIKVTINKEDPNEAKVVVELMFSVDDLTLSSYEHNTWKKVDGQWWFVEIK